MNLPKCLQEEIKDYENPYFQHLAQVCESLGRVRYTLRFGKVYGRLIFFKARYYKFVYIIKTIANKKVHDSKMAGWAYECESHYKLYVDFDMTPEHYKEILESIPIRRTHQFENVMGDIRELILERECQIYTPKIWDSQGRRYHHLSMELKHDIELYSYMAYSGYRFAHPAWLCDLGDKLRDSFESASESESESDESEAEILAGRRLDGIQRSRRFFLYNIEKFDSGSLRGATKEKRY